MDYGPTNGYPRYPLLRLRCDLVPVRCRLRRSVRRLVVHYSIYRYVYVVAFAGWTVGALHVVAFDVVTLPHVVTLDYAFYVVDSHLRCRSRSRFDLTFVGYGWCVALTPPDSSPVPITLLFRTTVTFYPFYVVALPVDVELR